MYLYASFLCQNRCRRPKERRILRSTHVLILSGHVQRTSPLNRTKAARFAHLPTVSSLYAMTTTTTTTQCVLSDEDVDRALDLERQNESDDWTLVSRTETEEYFYRCCNNDDSVPPIETKCRLRLDVPLNVAIRMLTEPELRNEWNGDVYQMNQVAGSCSGCKTILWKVRFPRCFKDRYMVQSSAVRYLEERDAYVILYKEGSHHPDAATLRGRCVRMTTGFSCSILRRDPINPRESSILFALANVTYGGFLDWFPAFILARLYASSLGGIQRRMNRAYRNSQDLVDGPVPSTVAPSPLTTTTTTTTTTPRRCSVPGIRFRATCV